MYAKETSVSVERSEAEIKQLVLRAKATTFASCQEVGRAAIVFKIGETTVKFTIPLPDPEEFRACAGGKRKRDDRAMFAAWEQSCRQRWRALLLCIKAKLESVEAGIECFEEAFLPQIVTKGGRTIWDRTKDEIPAIVKGNGGLLMLTTDKEGRS